MKVFTLLLLAVWLVSCQRTCFGLAKKEDSLRTIQTTNIDIWLTKGGHIQGIQKTAEGQYILSGSANKMAYLMLVNNQCHATSIMDISDTLLCETGKIERFNHASGFQIVEDYIFVGLEQKGNASSSSVVNVYDTQGNFVHRIAARAGTKTKTGTAGAVAAIQMNNGAYLVAVGSWDCRTVDFYESRSVSINSGFEKIGTWQRTLANRDKWIDKVWGSYQSLNLLEQPNGNVFLYGFCREGKTDFLDTYEVDVTKIKNSTSDCLHKVSRQAVNNISTSFKNGGGIYLDEAGKLQLLSTSKKVQKKGCFVKEITLKNFYFN